MADWLAGWSKRIEIKIEDYAGDIGGSVTWFPAEVFLKAASLQSQYPPEQSDTYVKSTTKYDTRYWAYFATDPTLSLTGTRVDNQWFAQENINSEQRFHIDLGSAKEVVKIYYENAHISGGSTNGGVQNFTFWGSNTEASFNELTYATNTGWIELTVAQNTFDEHTGSDVADPKYIVVTNDVAYRYYAFKFVDNYGHAEDMGIRRIELQAMQDGEVFTELTTDAEYKKIQFTEADGTSLLYGHMKLFDVSEEKGIFTVSADGWTVDSNTSIFLYYDKDHADNNTYIGAINTAACEAVYSDGHVGVWDMADGADNAHIYDATSHSNDGTKEGANEPIEVEGKVGQAQSFDGNNDQISITYSGEPLGQAFSSFAILAWIKLTDVTDYRTIFTRGGWSNGNFQFIIEGTTGKLRMQAREWSQDHQSTGPDLSDGTYHHVVMWWDGSVVKGYIDGEEDYSQAETNSISVDTDAIQIGERAGAINFLGIIDELQLLDIAPSPAWIKGSYNSGMDALFTYGSEEEAPAVKANAVFFGTNF